MNRKGYVKAALGIVVAFAIALVFYFAFSAMYGDGLERTMHEAGVEEQQPLYTGPFSYGGDYLTALAAGLIGAGITFVAAYGFLKISRKRGKVEEEGR